MLAFFGIGLPELVILAIIGSIIVLPAIAAAVVIVLIVSAKRKS